MKITFCSSEVWNTSEYFSFGNAYGFSL